MEEKIAESLKRLLLETPSNEVDVLIMSDACDKINKDYLLAIEALQGTILEKYDYFGLIFAKVPKEAVAQLATLDWVEYITPIAPQETTTEDLIDTGYEGEMIP